MTHDAESIRHLIYTLLNTPLRVDDTDFDIARGKVRLQSPEEGHFSYLQFVFGWIPLNPNKESVSAAIRESMLLLEDDVHRPRRLPSELGFRSLFEDLSNERIRLIIVVGKRGCGKTTSLNCFLDRYHPQLNSRGLTWFRSDVSKLYGTFRESGGSRPMSLREYHEAHALYVALCYAKYDTLLRCFELKDRKGPRTCSFWTRELAGDGDEDERSLWGDIVKILNSYEGHAPTFVQEIVGGFARGQREMVYRCLMARFFKAIRRLLVVEGDRNRVIQIVESIDNVDKRRDSARYNGFMSELLNLVGEPQKSPFSYDKLIAVPREDTYIDLKRRNCALPVWECEEIAEYFVDPVSPAMLVDKKSTIAVNPTSDHFRERRRKVRSSGIAYNEIWEAWFPQFAAS